MSKLGGTQLGVLQCLDRARNGEVRGVWHRRCGWEWSGQRTTIKALEGLRKLGLVCWDPDLAKAMQTPDNETYRLTPDGEAYIAHLKEPPRG
jgi:hypothetical protein